ncbi:hypothetical protein AB6G95_19290 [Proteus vulgaris]|uniref:hypothetical protein n=1 Tax=Proteus vulgaris TaxID=585 RepID=UPI0034DD74EC
MTEQKIAAVAGAVFQMRLLDGSEDQAGWIEVSEAEYHTPLHDPEKWEKRVLVETAYAPPPALDLACLNEARQCLFVLEQIGSLDHGDIDSDSIDLRFEIDGVDTGADVSVSEYAARSSAVISRLLTIISNSKSDMVTSDGATRRVQHSDDICFDAFALACKAKLAKARAKGRGGWESRTHCSDELLAEQLVAHLPKGNAGTFEDIAVFAMMLHQRGADPRVLADAVRVITEPATLPAEPTGHDCPDHIFDKFSWMCGAGWMREKALAMGGKPTAVAPFPDAWRFQKCPCCGGQSLTWDNSVRKNTAVQDGRLRLNEITGVFWLGCDECSETLIQVNADDVAAFLNICQSAGMGGLIEG